MANVTLPYKYIPRIYQKPLFNCLSEGYLRGLAIWHRRAGKDKTMINIAAKEMFKRVGAYYYFFPTYAQGKKILWDGIDRGGMRFLDHIPPPVRDGRPNSTEMKLRTKNGSLFQVVGSDSIDSIVGTNPIGCIFSEFALQDPRGYDFVRPILRENGGWALFNYTPRGYNHGHQLYEMALSNPDWFCEKLTINDTVREDGAPIITLDDIKAERAEGMSEELIQQEYYCSFAASIPGAYFADEMRDARDQGRICNIPPDPMLEVNSYWDIGISTTDSMTVWLEQTSGREIRTIAYYDAYSEPFLHFVKWLKDFKKSYKIDYGRHVLPHDGASKNPQTGKSSQEYLQELVNEHIGGMVAVARRPNRKQDGIEAIRQIIPKCYFDKKRCSDGINSLKQYHKEWDFKKKMFRHVHDWASHGTDGFQTLALSHKYKTSDEIWRPDRRKRKGIPTVSRRRYA